MNLYIPISVDKSAECSIYSAPFAIFTATKANFTPHKGTKSADATNPDGDWLPILFHHCRLQIWLLWLF